MLLDPSSRPIAALGKRNDLQPTDDVPVRHDPQPEDHRIRNRLRHLAAVQDHSGIAAVDRQAALGDRGQATGEVDGGRSLRREDRGIERDGATALGIQQRLPQGTRATVGDAVDHNGRWDSLPKQPDEPEEVRETHSSIPVQVVLSLAGPVGAHERKEVGKTDRSAPVEVGIRSPLCLDHSWHEDKRQYARNEKHTRCHL